MSNWSQITWNQRPTGILSNLYLTEDEDKSVMQWLDERETELRKQIAQEIKSKCRNQVYQWAGVRELRYGCLVNKGGNLELSCTHESDTAIARGDSK